MRDVKGDDEPQQQQQETTRGREGGLKEESTGKSEVAGHTI